jgi:uncharacterized membrane protein YccC
MANNPVVKHDFPKFIVRFCRTCPYFGCTARASTTTDPARAHASPCNYSQKAGLLPPAPTAQKNWLNHVFWINLVYNCTSFYLVLRSHRRNLYNLPLRHQQEGADSRTSTSGRRKQQQQRVDAKNPNGRKKNAQKQEPWREEEETGRGVLRCRERCGARSRPSTPHLAFVEGHEAVASFGLYNYYYYMSPCED